MGANFKPKKTLFIPDEDQKEEVEALVKSLINCFEGHDDKIILSSIVFLIDAVEKGTGINFNKSMVVKEE